MFKQMLGDNCWEQLYTNITKKYSEWDWQADSVLIQKQEDLIEECMNRLNRKKTELSTLNTEDISVINQYSSSYTEIKTKFAEEFQQSLAGQALKEVLEKCSVETYTTVKNYVQINRKRQEQSVSKVEKKLNKQIQNLSSILQNKQKNCLLLYSQVQNLKNKMKLSEDQRGKIKKKSQQLYQKQQRLQKLQISLLFKEKIDKDCRKRYEIQKQTLEESIKRVTVSYAQLYNLYEKVMKQCTDNQGNRTSSLQKNQTQILMHKMKDKLMEDREILKQEQKQIENKYDQLENCIKQFKKVHGLN